MNIEPNLKVYDLKFTALQEPGSRPIRYVGKVEIGNACQWLLPARQLWKLHPVDGSYNDSLPNDVSEDEMCRTTLSDLTKAAFSRLSGE